jgi:hypothetical protein
VAALWLHQPSVPGGLRMTLNQEWRACSRRLRSVAWSCGSTSGASGCLSPGPRPTTVLFLRCPSRCSSSLCSSRSRARRRERAGRLPQIQ